MKRFLACTLAALATVALAGPARANTEVRDGRILFFDGATSQIYSVRPDGGALRQLTHVPDGAGAVYPRWSFDGGRIVFVRFSGSAEDRLWTMRPDGTHQHRVLDDPGYIDQAPAFTPSGQSIVFNRCIDGGAACAIASVRTDGTGLRMLTPFTNDVFDFAPDVSSTGRVAFTRFNAGGITAQVYVLTSSGTARPVTPDWFGARLPKWSPDGQHIVMESCCQLSRDVFTIAPDGSHLTRLTRTDYPASRRWPSYSPTGTRIAYMGDRTPPDPFVTSNLFIMNADGTHEVLVPTGNLLNPAAPSWQPLRAE